MEIERYRFVFKVTSPRKTKLGDFRFHSEKMALPEITVNSDLNPYAFLFTFLHELAHLHVFKQWGTEVKAHGSEWKSSFQKLLLLAIRHELFPQELLEEILKFIAAPKASTSATPSLMKAFHKFDKAGILQFYLEDVKDGAVFIFQNRYFRRLRKKRTRVLCVDLQNERNYLISAMAQISTDSPS